LECSQERIIGRLEREREIGNSQREVGSSWVSISQREPVITSAARKENLVKKKRRDKEEEKQRGGRLTGRLGSGTRKKEVVDLAEREEKGERTFSKTTEGRWEA